MTLNSGAFCLFFLSARVTTKLSLFWIEFIFLPCGKLGLHILECERCFFDVDFSLGKEPRMEFPQGFISKASDSCMDEIAHENLRSVHYSFASKLYCFMACGSDARWSSSWLCGSVLLSEKGKGDVGSQEWISAISLIVTRVEKTQPAAT